MTTDPAPVTDEQISEWLRLADAATEGPWTTERPGTDALTGFTAGIIVAAVARGQGVYADPPRGSYPENDRAFIAASRTAVPALISKVKEQAAEIERLRKIVHGFLRCPEIADCAPDDKDSETDALEREARSALPEER